MKKAINLIPKDMENTTINFRKLAYKSLIGLLLAFFFLIDFQKLQAQCPVATSTPSSQTICSGTSPSIVLSSNISGTTFAWTVVQNGVTGGNNFSLITSQILTATGTNAGTAVYTITPEANGCFGSPITVTITVQGVVTGGTIAAAQTICSGGNPAAFTESAPSTGSGALTYAWKSSTDGYSATHATTTTYDIPAGLTATTTYRRITTNTLNGLSCTVNSNDVVVTVISKPTVVTTDQTVCLPATVDLTLSSITLGSTSGLTYSYYTDSLATIPYATPTEATAGTYYIVGLSVGGCSDTTAVTVNANSLPLATASPSSQTICSGETTSIALSSNIPGTTFSWTPIQSGVSGATVGAGDSITQILLCTGLQAGTTVYTITPEANGCTFSSISVTVTINSIPVTTASPSSQTFCSCSATSIALSSNIPGTTFSWTVIQTGVTGASAGTGGTIAQVLCTAGSVAGTAIYTITPTFNGCTGSPIKDTVIVNPTYDASFVYSSATYCQTGTNPTPAITGMPVGIFSASPVGLSINDSTGLINLATSVLGTYTVTYTITGTCPSSSSVNITITSAPSANFGYADTSYCQNANNPSPIFGSGASAGTFSSSPAGLVFVHINTGEIDLATSTLGTYTVTNTIPANGGCAAVSSSTIVTINLMDDASFVYSSVTYCQSGISTTPNLTGLQGGTYSASPVGLTINPTTGTADLVASSLGTYTVTYTTNGACPNFSSVNIALTASPSANFSYSDSAFCQFLSNPSPIFGIGESAGTFSAVPSGLVFVNVNTGEINLSTSAAGIYTVTNSIPSVGGCAASSATFQVTINSTPIIAATPSLQSICSGSSTSIVLSSSVSGTTYGWTAVQTNVSGASAGNGGTIVQTLTPIGSISGTAVYTITPTLNSCVGAPLNVTITVNLLPPVITATPSSQSICSGFNTSIALSSNTQGTIFSWTVIQTNVTGASASSGSGISQQILSTGTTTGTAVYTITPDVGGCIGASISVTIIVKPNPVVTATPSTQTICSGNLTSIALTSNIAGTNFYWTALQIGAVGAWTGGGSLIAQNLTSTGITPGKVIYTITPYSNNYCYGTPITDTVTVNPINTSFTYSSATYCTTGANQTPTITGIPGGVFSSSPAGLAIDSSTGIITLSTSALGIYNVSYTTNTPCPSTSSLTMTITSALSANFSYSDSVFCKIVSNPAPIYGTSASAGIFSATPSGLVFVHINTGEVDIAASAAGIYTVTNTIPASGTCLAISTTKTIHINNCIISGHLFKDNNVNCLMDSGDQNVWNIPVNLYDNNNNFISQAYPNWYNGNASYQFILGNLGIYTVKIDTAIIPYTVNCIYPGIDSTIILTGGSPSANNLNFAMVCKTGFDIGTLFIYNWGLAFPGLQHELMVYAGDMDPWYGINCSSGVSGQVQVTVTGPVTYNGPAPGGLTPSVSGNVYTYTIADFGIISNWQAFRLMFTTNTSAQAGDQICVNVIVTPTSGDNNPINNTYNFCYHVVNSYDPNIKEVYPVNVAPAYQDWFTYTIHFQNTGNASAMNIRLADTLDANLDFETFQLINYSDSIEVSLDNNLLNFHFPNIMLPDSTSDPEGSKGYVQYRVKPKANLPAGTQIKNTAYIYFDYNAPIVTNTTINEFIEPASINENLPSGTLSVYPNPGNGVYKIQMNNGQLAIDNYLLSIYNVFGEKIFQSEIKNLKTEIDISHQPNGIYIIRVNDGIQSLNQRLIKQ